MKPTAPVHRAPAEGTEVIARIRDAWRCARQSLLARLRPDGFWEGHLSSSALGTATALSAFALAAPARLRSAAQGVTWLCADQNPDGGWGDTPESPSNLPTTMLTVAAFRLAHGAGVAVPEGALRRAETFLDVRSGRTGTQRAAALRRLYGRDRTFAVPILVHCALAQAPTEEHISWNAIARLPFELACLPRALFRHLRLEVVSYALPALIAVGYLLHRRHPSPNPVARVVRHLAARPSLRRLEAIQPSSGGFLEAVPLTAFVVMNLAAAGRAECAVVRRALRFLEQTVRPDGSWPIDVNLSNWVTSLAVDALAVGGAPIPPTAAATVRRWLRARQWRTAHPYTGARPGGWAWTHLPGGVPDADDTAGALLALAALGGKPAPGVRAGVQWLLDLQNRDGGWPTFCRGWGRLPFDRSAPDLTAHSLRALWKWRALAPGRRVRRAVERGFAYLQSTQRPDGSWVPLWFGNQAARRQENPTFGTARVLAAYGDLGRTADEPARKGLAYLIEAQHAGGGWGGAPGLAATVEETAMAVDAISRWASEKTCRRACLRGARWLADAAATGGLDHPAPIGLYFARLWYAERMYPLVWTVGALGRALTAVRQAPPPTGAS